MDKKSALEHISGIIISELGEMDHEVGNDGYEHNTYAYEEDGWEVEINYRLKGEWGYEDGGRWSPSFDYLSDVDGDIEEIFIGYSNDDTGEYFEYDEEELSGLKQDIIDAVINSISLF